jgi:nitrate/nitrite transporter NarK
MDRDALAVVPGIPSLLFGPWGGAVADRVDLRKLLLVTQTLYCLLAALLSPSEFVRRTQEPSALGDVTTVATMVPPPPKGIVSWK